MNFKILLKQFFNNKLNIVLLSFLFLTILFALLSNLLSFFAIISIILLSCFCFCIALKFLLPKNNNYSKFFQENKEKQDNRLNNFIEKTNKRTRIITGISFICLAVVILWFAVRSIFKF